jgi:hypothetical protein
VKEGTSWEETRCMLGKQSKLITCVTSIGVITNVANISYDRNGLPVLETQKHQKCIRTSISVLDKIVKVHCLESKTCTSTVSIGWDEAVNHVGHNHDYQFSARTHSDSSRRSCSKMPVTSSMPKKCQLTITMAFISKNAIVCWKLMMARPCGVRSIVNSIMQLEVDEIVREAVRREKCMTQDATVESF